MSFRLRISCLGPVFCQELPEPYGGTLVHL